MSERPDATLLLEQLHCIKEGGDLSSLGDVYMKIYLDGNPERRWPSEGEVNMDSGDFIDVNINVTYASNVRVEVFDRDSIGNDDLLGIMMIPSPSPDQVLNETFEVLGEKGEDNAKYGLCCQFIK